MKETKLSTYDDLLLFTIDWRNRTTTKQLIDSLVPLHITLWIIINDDIEEEYQLPVGAQLNLRTYRVGYNIGFAGACNIAINIAKKYNKLYILHMNNDIILSETEKFIQFITLFKNNTL